MNKKYRKHVLKRLGLGLGSLVRRIPAGKTPRIWLHALSVGEVASVITLVRKIRREIPEAIILFSCTTSSGEDYARASLKDDADFVFAFPFDIFWLVERYIRSISPHLFILVETDFWPNYLSRLKKHNVPTLLVNGRISARSHRSYQYLRPVFLPMFMTFDCLAVQRRLDRKNIIDIGVPAEKVIQLGNLKYEGILLNEEGGGESIRREDFGIPAEALVLVAGSTHPGEEEMILDFFQTVAGGSADLRVIIAPRKVERSSKVLEKAGEYGFSCRLKSSPPAPDTQVLILDTLGELAEIYGLADLAFVGGSLVPEGGHNPLEPAALGKSVLFGPYMEEFYDISSEMVEEEAAVQVGSAADLISQGRSLLEDSSLREKLGGQALNFVKERQGVVDKYFQVIEDLLKNSPDSRTSAGR
ncbi:MAG: 3-deoxy-D-manno-octulosonic acid transferase [Desulfurivibrionaceae bacterium]